MHHFSAESSRHERGVSDGKVTPKHAHGSVTPQPVRSRKHHNSKRKFKRSITLASIPDQVLQAASEQLASTASSSVKQPSVRLEESSKAAGKKKKKKKLIKGEVKGKGANFPKKISSPEKVCHTWVFV